MPSHSAFRLFFFFPWFLGWLAFRNGKSICDKFLFPEIPVQMAVDPISGISYIPNKGAQLFGVLISIILQFADFSQLETRNIHAIFLPYHIGGTVSFDRSLIPGITAIMGIHAGTGKFPADRVKGSGLTPTIADIDHPLPGYILCLYSFRKVIRNTDRHFGIRQECLQQYHRIPWFRGLRRPHTDLADIIGFPYIGSLHFHTIFFIFIGNQELISMHPRP